jgi:hypothetical protein
MRQSNRRSLGLQPKQQRIADASRTMDTRVNGRSISMDDSIYDDMDGAGIMDLARGIWEKGKSAGKFLYGKRDAIANVYTGEVGTAIRNALPDSDDTARPGFAGERHAILKLPNGRNGVANYMGPATSVIKRLERGDMGRTAVDSVSKAHDIRYTLARNLGDVRKADNIMINAVKRIEANKGDDPRNILLAKAITAKRFAEDIGVLKKDAFSGDVSSQKVSARDRNILESNLGGLVQKGYGLNLPGAGMLPGDALRAQIVKKMKKDKKKKAKPESGKPSKMIGSMSGKGAILNMVSKSLVPLLMKNLNIPSGALSADSISKIVSQALNNSKKGDMTSVISNLTKSILSMLTGAKMQTMGMPLKGDSMSGRGLSDILGSAKAGLRMGLGRILVHAFKTLDKMKMGGKGARGLSMSGQGFWSSFVKGFKMVFKPFAKIAGPVLSAVGMPEFGAPLSAIGKVL